MVVEAKGNEVKARSLVSVIQWLDGFRAYRCVEPDVLRREFMRHSRGYMRRVWRNVKEDVYRIATFAASSPKIRRIYLTCQLSRWLMLILGTLVFTLLMVRIVPLRGVGGFIELLREAAGIDPLMKALAAGFCTFMILYYVMNYLAVKNMLRYYEEHEDVLGRSRENIRQSVQELIRILIGHIRRHNLDPQRHELVLYHNDYEGISVRGRTRRGRYIATVKA